MKRLHIDALPSRCQIIVALSTSWFTASFHRLRALVILGNDEEHGDVGRQCGREASQKVDGRIKVTSLNSAYGCSINVRIDGQILLRHALSGPDFSKIPADAVTMLHGVMATILPSVNPSNIYHIFRVNVE